MRRFRMIGLLGLCALGSGCATSATRDVQSPTYKQSVWSGAAATAPAPAQTQATMTPERLASTGPASSDMTRPQGLGLTKYFPSFKPAPPDPTRLATNQRPSWFGLRRLRSAPATPSTPARGQVYETDARVAMNRGAVPSLLPVALQVPPADSAVTTTSATRTDADAANSSQPIADMPALPPIDPQQTPKPTPAVAPIDDAAPPDVRPALEASPIVETPAKDQPSPPTEVSPIVETQAKDQPSPPTEVLTIVETQVKAKPSPPADTKAVKAIEVPSNPLGLPEATVPASYSGHKSMNTGGNLSTYPGMVLASPQSAPPASKPSPQAGVKSTTSTPKWKQNAICRGFRKFMKVDETQ